MAGLTEAKQVVWQCHKIRDRHFDLRTPEQYAADSVERSSMALTIAAAI